MVRVGLGLKVLVRGTRRGGGEESFVTYRMHSTHRGKG